MLHDCRHPYEPDTKWQARLAAARRTCMHCPVFDACAQLRDHYAGRRNGVDGILAGRPVAAPHCNRKDTPWA